MRKIQAAISCRRPAKIDLFLPPGGPGTRIDSHLYSGYVVPSLYDSLLGKIIVWGTTDPRRSAECGVPWMNVLSLV